MNTNWNLVSFKFCTVYRWVYIVKILCGSPQFELTISCKSLIEVAKYILTLPFSFWKTRRNRSGLDREKGRRESVAC